MADRLDIVLGRQKWAGLKLKPLKCSLFRRNVTFLGHVVSSEGISMQPEKKDFGSTVMANARIDP